MTIHDAVRRREAKNEKLLAVEAALAASKLIPRRWLHGYMLAGSQSATRCWYCHGVLDADNPGVSERVQTSGPGQNDAPIIYSGDFSDKPVHRDRMACQQEKQEQRIAERREKNPVDAFIFPPAAQR